MNCRRLVISCFIPVICLGVLLGLATTASGQVCYNSSISSPTPFMGNNGEMFILSDRSIWEVKYEYEYLYEYYPSITICPSLGKLIIDGKSLNVEHVSGGIFSGGTNEEVIETSVSGAFEGWDGETIVKLMNGQFWQQIDYHYEYQYSYSPSVILYKVNGVYKMQVDGTDQSITVRRIPDPVIETSVSGAFEGWDGETIVKLMNGQIWQQIEYHYEYQYSY